MDFIDNNTVLPLWNFPKIALLTPWSGKSLNSCLCTKYRRLHQFFENLKKVSNWTCFSSSILFKFYLPHCFNAILLYLFFIFYAFFKSSVIQFDLPFNLNILLANDFMSLGFPPSYYNFPMHHRNDKLLTARIILIYLFI